MKEEIEKICSENDALKEAVKAEELGKSQAQHEKVALEMKMAELEEQKEGMYTALRI